MNSVVTSYEVRELFPLGKGGMGTTYLGCAKGAGGFERLVTIKRLHEHLQEDPEACIRLLAEAELAGCVHHSNVVAVQHVDRDVRGAFLVLDYVEGGSMKELMRQAAPGKIPEPIALRLMLDCLAGLDAIHNAKDHRGRPLKILHRDISPENVLVGLDGMARLTDFGIARSSQRPALTAPSQLVGKLGFMAPEYVDRGNLGPPLDIYSLGVTLWMLLVGRSPWRGLEEAQLLAKLLTEGVPPLPRKIAVSPSLRSIVEKACAMDAKKRYQSAREMASMIESCGVLVAEHSEVAAYVDKQFECATSERRLEAAQLLNRESSRPPPSSSLLQIRNSERLQLSDSMTRKMGTQDLGQEDPGSARRMDLESARVDSQNFLDERSTVTRGVVVSVPGSVKPRNSRVKRLLLGASLTSILAACGILALGYFGEKSGEEADETALEQPRNVATSEAFDEEKRSHDLPDGQGSPASIDGGASPATSRTGNADASDDSSRATPGKDHEQIEEEGLPGASSQSPERQTSPVRRASTPPLESEIVARNPYRGR